VCLEDEADARVDGCNHLFCEGCISMRSPASHSSWQKTISASPLLLTAVAAGGLKSSQGSRAHWDSCVRGPILFHLSIYPPPPRPARGWRSDGRRGVWAAPLGLRPPPSLLSADRDHGSMQAVHPMFGPDEMSSRPLASSFTSAERGMHSSPAARQQFPWQAMLAATLFVSGTCVGYAVAVFQHTHRPVPLVQQFYAGMPPAVTSRERGGTTEGGRAEGGRADGGTAEAVDVAEGVEAASGCCGPCSSAALQSA